MALLVMAVVAFLVDRGGQQDGQTYTTYEVYQTSHHPGQLAGTSSEGSQRGDIEKGESGRTGYEQRVIIRSSPPQGVEKDGGGMPTSVAVGLLAVAIAALGHAAARATAIEARPGTRARLLPSLPKEAPGMLRLENFGKTSGLLVGYAWGRLTDSDRRIPKSMWDKLNHVSRLVGSEEGQRLDLPIADFADGGRLVILIQYEDVFGDTWDAWRIFTSISWDRVPECEGEQRGYKRYRRRHFPILPKSTEGLKIPSKAAG